jgi:hypothetical protein
LNPHPQLRNGDRRDRDIVAIADRFGQSVPTALGVDENRGIEDQSRQGSVTGSTVSRSFRNSLAHAASGR